MTPARCRRCGAAIYRARETGVRAVALAADVEAEPMSALIPLERAPPGLTVWELHPRHGWICLDMPVRRGWPIHIQHICKHQHDTKEGRQ